MNRTFCIVFGILAMAAVASAQGAPAPAANPPAPLPPITNTDYEISSTWFQLPAGMELGQPLAVAADGKGNLFLLRRRADPPILVFDRQGKYLRGWGEGMFGGQHSIDVDRNGFVWTTDNTDNMIYKFSADGKL